MSTPAQTLQSERFQYPGLLPREIIILRQWLKLHQQEWQRWVYNLRVGQGLDPGTGWTPEVRRSAIINSMKRIDAVAFNGSPEWLATFDAWYNKPAQVIPLVNGNTDVVSATANLWLAPVPLGWTDALILEVKDRAGPPALGQLITYRELWLAAEPGTKAPALMIVTNRVTPDLLVPAKALGIGVEVVEASFDELKRST